MFLLASSVFRQSGLNRFRSPRLPTLDAFPPRLGVDYHPARVLRDLLRYLHPARSPGCQGRHPARARQDEARHRV